MYPILRTPDSHFFSLLKSSLFPPYVPQRQTQLEKKIIIIPKQGSCHRWLTTCIRLCTSGGKGVRCPMIGRFLWDFEYGRRERKREQTATKKDLHVGTMGRVLRTPQCWKAMVFFGQGGGLCYGVVFK